MGAEERQQEAHDLPEDVPGPQELRPDRAHLQGEEKAHLPVRTRHADVPAEVLWTRFLDSLHLYFKIKKRDSHY